MFKKSDDKFFGFVDTIQKIIIFLIVASIVAGAFLFYIGIVPGIIVAVILPVMLIITSLIFHAICYIAIDVKIQRNKIMGEDVQYLLDLLDSKPQKPEKPNPNQPYIDLILKDKTQSSENDDSSKGSQN